MDRNRKQRVGIEIFNLIFLILPLRRLGASPVVSRQKKNDYDKGLEKSWAIVATIGLQTMELNTTTQKQN